MKRLLPIAVLALVLAGCTANEPGPPPSGTPTPTASATSTPSPAVTPTPAMTATSAPAPSASAPAPAVYSIPSPNADQEALLVAYLNEVDPALVGDDGVVNHSRDQCSSILGGASQDSLISSTKLRFETATFTPTTEQATAILDAIRASGFCVTP